MTSGAVSATKGEGAGRHAGPAAASVISIAAPISRSGARSRPRPSRPMVSAASRCGAICSAAGACAGILPAQQQPERRQRQAAPAAPAAAGRRRRRAPSCRRTSRDRRRRTPRSEERRRHSPRATSSDEAAAGSAASGVRGRQEVVAPCRAPAASISRRSPRGRSRPRRGGSCRRSAAAIAWRAATSTRSASALASGSPTAMVWMTTPFCAAMSAALAGRHPAAGVGAVGEQDQDPRLDLGSPRRSGWRARSRRRAWCSSRPCPAPACRAGCARRRCRG